MTDNRFDVISRKAGEWSLQPGLLASQREAARTLHLMARRLGNAAGPEDLIADKSLKILGCYVCRLTGHACCSMPTYGREICPLGFVAGQPGA